MRPSPGFRAGGWRCARVGIGRFPIPPCPVRRLSSMVSHFWNAKSGREAAPIRRGAIRMLLTLTAWGVSEVLVFQAAGARALHPLATAAPSLGLLLLVLVESHLARRLSRDEAWI